MQVGSSVLVYGLILPIMPVEVDYVSFEVYFSTNFIIFFLIPRLGKSSLNSSLVRLGRLEICFAQ